MPRLPALLTLLVTLAATCATGCATGTGDRAPDWALADIHGRTHALSDYRGKVVVLDFWATWCGPCRPVSAVMQDLHERFMDDDVVVLAIHYDDKGDPAAYMREHAYSYTSLVSGSDVCRTYGVSKIPTIMVIDRAGLIVHRQTGFGQGDATRLAEIIEDQL